MIPQVRYNDVGVTMPGQSIGAPDMGSIRGSMPEEYAPDTTKTVKSPLNGQSGALVPFQTEGP